MNDSPWAVALWMVMGFGLVAYAVTGGADLGAGLWSLLASGPRKEAQRRAISEAIAPIWEANHVWLIFVIVVMFSAFSRAFAAISIALHIPIALALLGIVLRGAAYVFHAYGIQSQGTKDRWTRVFSWASAVTPLLLGMVLGAVSSSDILWVDGVVQTGFFAGWTTPFAVLVGLFACSLFALLSAVYLAADSHGEISEDFRKRALFTEGVAFVLAAAVFFQARSSAPDLFRQLAGSSWTLPIQLATAAAAGVTIATLWRRQLLWSRYSVAVQVGLVVVGWGAAMDRHFVLPNLDLRAATTNAAVLPYLALALAIGAVLLVPSLWYLYRVFKGGR